MQQAQLIADDEVGVTVAIHISEGRMTALDAVEGEVNCRPCTPFQGRLGCGSRVLEQGEGRRRIIDALVAFFVAYGEVQISVSIEVVQHGNGATSHINGPVLDPMVGDQCPQRGIRCPLIFPQLNASVVIDFQGDVRGNNQVPIAIVVWVNRIRSGEPFEEDAVGFSGVRHEGREGHVYPSGAVLAIGGVFQHESAHGGVGDVGDEQIVEVFSVKLQRGNGASSVHAIALVECFLSGGGPAFRIDDVEAAVVIGSDEQGIVLGPFRDHSIAAVRTDQIQPACRLSRKAVQRRTRLRETDKIEVAVVVYIENGRLVDGQTHQWQFLLAGAEVPAGSQGQRIRLERGNARSCRRVAVDVNAVLVPGEQVGHSIAIEITQQHPVLERRPALAPVWPLIPTSVRGLFENQNAATVTVKRKQVHVAVPVDINFGPLRCTHSPCKRMRHGILLHHHFRPGREVPAPRGLPLGLNAEQGNGKKCEVELASVHVGKLFGFVDYIPRPPYT